VIGPLDQQRHFKTKTSAKRKREWDEGGLPGKGSFAGGRGEEKEALGTLSRPCDRETGKERRGVYLSPLTFATRGGRGKKKKGRGNPTMSLRSQISCICSTPRQGRRRKGKTRPWGAIIQGKKNVSQQEHANQFPKDSGRGKVKRIFNHPSGERPTT